MLTTRLTTPSTTPSKTRFTTRFRLASLALAATVVTGALTGCAALSNLRSEVSTYSQWPSERKPGTYAFERLPSQQANAEQQQRLEDAARPAVEAAGFTPAAAGAQADFTVQLGARVNIDDRALYADPFWWHGGVYRSRFGVGFGGGYGAFGGRFGGGFGPWGIGTPTYEREVAVLIRDRRSSTPLYESRASNDGGSPSMNSLLSAMYEAALKDFPNGGATPRVVVTRIAP